MSGASRRVAVLDSASIQRAPTTTGASRGGSLSRAVTAALRNTARSRASSSRVEKVFGR